MKNRGNPDASPGAGNTFEQQFSGNSFLPDIPMLSIPSPRLVNSSSRSPSPQHPSNRPSDGTEFSSSGQEDMASITVSQLQDRVNKMTQRLMLIEQFVYASYGQMVSQQYTPMMSANPSSSSRSRANSGSGEPKMRELDEVCLEEFALNPYPVSVEINRMASKLLAHYQSTGLRPLGSAIRKWYRKKRDENGMKIFTACLTHIQPLVDSGMGVEAVWERLEGDPAIYERILEEARLDITEPRMALRFLKKKIKSYFIRRVLPPGAAHVGPAGFDESDDDE